MRKTKKTIKSRLNRTCSCCGKPLKVIIYSDKSYRGGHYWGKIGLTTKKADREALKAGSHPWNFHGMILQVTNKEPVPYKYIEDWECFKCYWKK